MGINLNKRDIDIFNFNNLIRSRRRIKLNAIAQVGGSGGGGEEPTYPVPEGVPVVTVADSFYIALETGRFVSRPSCSVAFDAIEGEYLVRMTYRTGDTNGDTINELVHQRVARISELESLGAAAWSEEDEWLDGTPVGGMPMTPPGAGFGDARGPVEAWHYKVSDEKSYIHTWNMDYTTDSHGTWQAVTEDGHRNWGVLSQITFNGATLEQNDRLLSDDDHFDRDGVFYYAVRETETEAYYNNSFSPAWLPIKQKIIKTVDEFTTHDVIGDMTDFIVYPSHETGIEHTGDQRIVALTRGKLFDVTIKEDSSDFGATWTNRLIENTCRFTGVIGRNRIMTLAHLKREPYWWNDQILIACGFDTVARAAVPRRNTMWVSKDRGNRWFGPFYLDEETGDAGYGHFFYNHLTEQIIITLYHGEDTEAGIKQYVVDLTWSAPSVNVLFQDDMVGGTLNTLKWVKTNPDATNLLLTQNDRLFIYRVTDSVVASSFTNNFKTLNSFDQYGVLTGFLNRRKGFSVSAVRFGMYKDANNRILVSIESGTIRCQVTIGGVAVYNFNTTLVWTSVRVKIVYTASAIRFYRFGGTSANFGIWVEMGSYTTPVTLEDWFINFSAQSDAADAIGDCVTLHDVKVTDVDYSTILPADNTVDDYATRPTIHLEEYFEGTTINPVFETANPNAADLLISQKGKLIFRRVTDNAVASTLTNYVRTSATYSSGVFAVTFRRDLGFANGSAAFTLFVDTSNFIQVFHTNTGFTMRMAVGGVTTNITADVAITNNNQARFKFVYTGTTVTFYKWVDGFWLMFGSTTNCNLGAAGKVYLHTNSSTSDAPGDSFSFGGLAITDTDYASYTP